jgi:hypothetical protein
MEDWLPCCSGGFFDIPSHNFDKERVKPEGHLRLHLPKHVHIHHEAQVEWNRCPVSN